MNNLFRISYTFFENQKFLFLNIKEFENLSVEKRRFRLRWNSSLGLSISGRLL